MSWLDGITDLMNMCLSKVLETVKNRLIAKDPDAGKDRRWEEKGTTEDELVGWHQRLNGHEFE